MDLRELGNILHRLKILEQKLTQNFEEATGFSLTRHQILVYLMDHDGCRQADIQGYLNIDRAAVTRQLKILEEEGYVTRECSQADAREILVFLSHRSHEIIKETHGICDSIQIGFGINEQELRELDALLVKIEDRFTDV